MRRKMSLSRKQKLNSYGIYARRYKWINLPSIIKSDSSIIALPTCITVTFDLCCMKSDLEFEIKIR